MGDGGFDSAAWHKVKSVSRSDDFKTPKRFIEMLLSVAVVTSVQKL